MDEVARQIAIFRLNGKGVLVVEVPLLVEVGATAIVDKVLVVTAEQETQIERLQKRYDITRPEAVLRVHSQLPMADKIKHADWVISTEGALRTTKRRVERLWSDIQEALALRS
jgi:dephospho-CoA kinase